MHALERSSSAQTTHRSHARIGVTVREPEVSHGLDGVVQVTDYPQRLRKDAVPSLHSEVLQNVRADLWVAHLLEHDAVQVRIAVAVVQRCLGHATNRWAQSTIKQGMPTEAYLMSVRVHVREKHSRICESHELQ
jgi:hypothetical protein